MQLRVNDQVIASGAIARETALYAGTADPEGAARRALAVRALLVERARALALVDEAGGDGTVVFASRADEDALIAKVLDAEVKTPTPTEAECRRYFDAHPERFTAGELVEASHILFAVTPGTPVSALRARAEGVLAELKAHPERFPQRAAELSNCPSGAQGGSLGQFGPGEMVPEFDRAIFGGDTLGVLPMLVQTRYGFHVVHVARRIPGRPLPFEAALPQIASHLSAMVQERALAQYVSVLASGASVEGVELAAATSPLVQ